MFFIIMRLLFRWHLMRITLTKPFYSWIPNLATRLNVTKCDQRVFIRKHFRYGYIHQTPSHTVNFWHLCHIYFEHSTTHNIFQRQTLKRSIRGSSSNDVEHQIRLIIINIKPVSNIIPTRIQISSVINIVLDLRDARTIFAHIDKAKTFSVFSPLSLPSFPMKEHSIYEGG